MNDDVPYDIIHTMCNILDCKNSSPLNILDPKTIHINKFSLVNKYFRKVVIEYILQIINQIYVDFKSIKDIFNIFNQTIFIDQQILTLDDIFNKFFISNKQYLEKKFIGDKQIILVLQPGLHEIVGNHKINFNLKITGINDKSKHQKAIIKKVWYLSKFKDKPVLFRSDKLPLFEIDNVNNITRERKINFSLNNIDFLHIMSTSIISICNSKYPFNNELLKFNFDMINCSISGIEKDIDSFSVKHGVINIYSSDKTNCYARLVDCTFSDIDTIITSRGAVIDYVNNKSKNIKYDNIIEN